jgi:hypothetical protein
MDEEKILESALLVGKLIKSKEYAGSGYLVEDREGSYDFSGVRSHAAIGWLCLFNRTKNEEFLAEGKRCADWLVQNQTKEGGWIFPAPMGSNLPGKQYSCNAIFAAEALAFCNKVAGNKKYLDSAVRAFDFLRDYSGFVRTGKGLMINYEKEFPQVVPNVSALAAGLASDIYRVSEDKGFLNDMDALADFSINNQAPDGGYLYYDSKEDPRTVSMDYHCYTIWELKKVLALRKSLGQDARRIEESIAKGLSFLEKATNADGAVKYRAKGHFSSRYPSFLANMYYSRLYLGKNILWAAKAYYHEPVLDGRYAGIADNCIEYAIRNLQGKDGSFHVLKKSLPIPSRSKLTSVRLDAIAFEILSQRLSQARL